MAQKPTTGEELRTYRRRRRVSQHDLATRAGFAHRAAICKRETGEVAMSMSELFHLCSLVEAIWEDRVVEHVSPAEVLAE